MKLPKLDVRLSWQRILGLWCSGMWYCGNTPWRCKQHVSPKFHLWLLQTFIVKPTAQCEDWFMRMILLHLGILKLHIPTLDNHWELDTCFYDICDWQWTQQKASELLMQSHETFHTANKVSKLNGNTTTIIVFYGLCPLTTFLPALLIFYEFLWTSFSSISWVNLPQTETINMKALSHRSKEN